MFLKPLFAVLFILFPALSWAQADIRGLGGLSVDNQRLTKGGIVTVQASSKSIGFKRWISRFRSTALRQGISKTTFDQAFRNISYNSDVIRKDRNQSEFTKQIWEYLDSAVSETRVRNGKDALRKNKRVLQSIEAHYGVDKEIVAAIWGLESAYGKFRGDVPVIEALATLAYDGRRGAFFEKQLIAALKIIQSGDVRARNMTGSWAGAMGHTQFIPTSFLAYAVDGTGDGKRDIWSDNPADALASTAAYLARFGWRKGHPWGVEVRLPDSFDYSHSGSRVQKSVAQWAALGVRDVYGKKVSDYGSASILLPAGAQGAVFMIFHNFKVIERYNQADAYVIAVGHLADQISGGPALKSGWPRNDRPLSFAEKKDLQKRLTAAGFDTFGLDGVVGPNTIAAIKAFQSSTGLPADGYPSANVLRRLR